MSFIRPKHRPVWIKYENRAQINQIYDYFTQQCQRKLLSETCATNDNALFALFQTLSNFAMLSCF